MELGDKGTVCVTGGTGFVGSWLIKRLLEDGYSVHTTVRPDPEKKRDLSFLTSLPRAAEKLKIFRADLSDPNSFDEAIEGCKGVLLVAALMEWDNKEPEQVVNQRSIDGTLGILKACLKSRTVKRVVYTSSAAAVLYNNNKDVEMMDESFWSDVDYIRQNNMYRSSYSISKTLTERAALEFAAQHGLDLVTVIPPLVVGPFICPNLPLSVRTPFALVLENQPEFGSLQNLLMVHVDDLVKAHIFLLEYPDAKGRYICCSDTISLQNMAEILSAKCPELPIPSPDSFAEIKGVKFPGFSSKKLLDTGFKFKYGADEMLEDGVNCCKEKGFSLTCLEKYI